MKKSMGSLGLGGVAALVSMLVAGATCQTGETGRVSADGVGDVSNPPAVRAQADKELVEACGDGELVQPSGLRRAPYVQAVTDRGAAVLWTSTAAAPARLVVTQPNGEPVATVDAERNPAQRTGAPQYEARVSGLRPWTIYCYQVREGDAAVTHRTGFRTAPAAGSEVPVHVVVVGDNGFAGPDQDAVLAQVATVPFDLWINTGDVGFDKGTLDQFEDNLFSGAARLMRSMPFYPASGNHDYATDDAAAFREVFDLPRNGGPAGAGRWYSFDWGQVHFVALDTERYSNEQTAWLDADLTANQLPWVIVYGHRPPYSSGAHGSDHKFRNYFGAVLEKHHVPLVLCGHDHSYERVKPQNGVHYVVTGGGGASTRSVGTSDFTAFSSQVLHFVYITVDGGRLALHAIDATGREFDSLVIERPAAEEGVANSAARG